MKSMLGQVLYSIILVLVVAFVIIYANRNLPREHAERVNAEIAENNRAARCAQPLRNNEIGDSDCKPGEVGYDPSLAEISRVGR